MLYAYMVMGSSVLPKNPVNDTVGFQIEQFRLWRAAKHFPTLTPLSAACRWPTPMASAPLLMKVLELYRLRTTVECEITPFV